MAAVAVSAIAYSRLGREESSSSATAPIQPQHDSTQPYAESAPVTFIDVQGAPELPGSSAADVRGDSIAHDDVRDSAEPREGNTIPEVLRAVVTVEAV
jgi:hypothetical protein